jgi:hypothetical protein
MSGGVIINRSEIKGAVAPGTDHFSRLPQWAQDKVTDICAKGMDTWDDAEVRFMHAAALMGAE